MLFGGRWNSPGRRVINASTSYACAMLEVLAHTGTGRIPRKQCAITIGVPGSIDIEQIAPEGIPGWDRQDMTASRSYGDAWLNERRTAIVLVPSAVARYDWNVLINSEHSDLGAIKASESEPGYLGQAII
jgi:RES domain-containing protein